LPHNFNEEIKMQTTKRYPRTLEEAFGPYARGPICEPYTEMDMVDKIISGICGVVLFGLLLAIVTGVI
jgi:hypothetical protein